MIILILIILGLCFGSFINALVFRLHEQSKQGRGERGEGRGKKSKLTPDRLPLNSRDLSILKGRSMCVHCHHTLAWYDLIPVISWLWLRGKCRYCHKNISYQYPAIELATAALFVLSYTYFPLELTQPSPLNPLPLILWLAALIVLIALTVYDLKWMLLPDKLTFTLAGLATASVLAEAFIAGSYSLLVEAALGGALLAGLFFVLFQVSSGRWIGGGDVKLGLGIGLLAGSPLEALLLLFLASLGGSAIAVPLMLAGKLTNKSRIPFGPLLIAATVAVYLFGSDMIEWYQATFLTY